MNNDWRFPFLRCKLLHQNIDRVILGNQLCHPMVQHSLRCRCRPVEAVISSLELSLWKLGDVSNVAAQVSVEDIQVVLFFSGELRRIID